MNIEHQMKQALLKAGVPFKTPKGIMAGNWVEVHGTRFHFDASGELSSAEDVGEVKRVLAELAGLKKTSESFIKLQEDVIASAVNLADRFDAIEHLLDDSTRRNYAELLDHWVQEA